MLLIRRFSLISLLSFLCLHSLAQEKTASTNHTLFIANRIDSDSQPLNSYLQSDISLVSIRNKNNDNSNRIADISPNEIPGRKIL